MHGPLTYNDMISLSDILRGVMTKSRVEIYPLGSTRPDCHASYVMRAFTRENGSFISAESDVRDAYVWLSGTMELFKPVPDMMRAMQNAIDARHGLDAPMALINPDAA